MAEKADQDDAGSGAGQGESDPESQLCRLPMVMPPSTTMDVPVTNSDSSLAR